MALPARKPSILDKPKAYRPEAHPHWSMWLAIALLFATGAWNAKSASDHRANNASFKVQVRGLPQVIRETEMDCGCVPKCTCCKCQRPGE